MKRLFLISMTAGMMLLNGSSLSAQQQVINRMPEIVATEAYSNASLVRLPQTELRYTWEDEQWKKKREQKYLYNEKNDIYEKFYYYYSNNKLSDCFHYTMEFNENGSVTKETQQWKYGDEKDWYNFLIFEYSYDDVVTNFRTQKSVYMWDASRQEWYYDESGSNKSFFTEIERDANNRILHVQKWKTPAKDSPLAGYYYEYDGEGGAVRMTVKNNNGSNGLAATYFYDNIVWEKTNGQYLKNTNDAYAPFALDDKNIIKSFTMYSIDNAGNKNKEADVIYNWDDQNNVKDIVINYADGTSAMNMNVYNILTNGNYNNYFFYWKDLNGNMSFDKGEEIRLEEAKLTVYEKDQYGNDMSEEVFLYDDSTGDLTKSDSKISRNPQYLEDGTLKEFVYTYEKQGTVLSKEKFVYDDFIEQTPTDIGEVPENNVLKVYEGYVAARNGMHYRICDMEGRTYRSGTVSDSKVSLYGMPAGMYIVRINDDVVKVVKR